MRSFDPTFEPNGVVGVRRLEVITGVGGRRSWSRDDKARIVAELFAARANVSAVARRYGLRPQQVYAWRRLARAGGAGFAGRGRGRVRSGRRHAGGDAGGSGAVAGRRRRDRDCRRGDPRRAGVDWRLLRDVLRAVKAAM